MRVADGLDIRPMVRDAQREAAPRRKRRGYRIALGVGVAAVFVGGAGAAAAGGMFSWTGWAANPDIAYDYTLPSGRTCEIRIAVDAAPSAGDGIATPSAVGAALRDWARAADFSKIVDVPAQMAALDRTDGVPLAWKQSGKPVHPDPNGPHALMTVLTSTGHLDYAPKTAAGPTQDALYATAVNFGLTAALEAKAAQLGGGQGWSTSLAVQCTPVAQ